MLLHPQVGQLRGELDDERARAEYLAQVGAAVCVVTKRKHGSLQVSLLPPLLQDACTCAGDGSNLFADLWHVQKILVSQSQRQNFLMNMKSSGSLTPSHASSQARDNALSEVEDLRHEVAALRAASPVKTLRMSRSDSEEEEVPAEQVRRQRQRLRAARCQSVQGVMFLHDHT